MTTLLELGVRTTFEIILMGTGYASISTTNFILFQLLFKPPMISHGRPLPELLLRQEPMFDMIGRDPGKLGRVHEVEAIWTSRENVKTNKLFFAPPFGGCACWTRPCTCS